MSYDREHPTILAVLILIAATSVAQATPRHDFHGLLFKCGGHPTVQVSGRVAYAYEADLTTYVAGTARLRTDAVTVSFSSRYAAFTIARRGRRFFVGPVACQADDV